MRKLYRFDEPEYDAEIIVDSFADCGVVQVNNHYREFFTFPGLHSEDVLDRKAQFESSFLDFLCVNALWHTFNNVPIVVGTSGISSRVLTVTLSFSDGR